MPLPEFVEGVVDVRLDNRGHVIRNGRICSRFLRRDPWDAAHGMCFDRPGIGVAVDYGSLERYPRISKVTVSAHLGGWIVGLVAF